jgi:flagellar assembly protein FliH
MSGAMNTSTRFLFDTEFSDSSAPVDAGKAAAEITAVYSEKDIEALKLQAYEEGLQLGKTEAMETVESTLASSLETVAIQLQQLSENHNAELHIIKQDAASLALAIAGKLAPALIEQSPFNEMEAIIKDCLSELPEEPRIVVRAPEQACEFLKPQVDTLSAQTGFQGNIILLPEESMKASECRVEWADGGVERNIQDTETKLSAIINEFVHGTNERNNLVDEVSTEPSIDDQ